MKFEFLPKEKTFIESQLLILAQFAAEARDDTFLKKILRTADKFTINSTTINLKLKELEVIYQCTTKTEHELSQNIIPKMTEEEKITKAKELLQQVETLNQKLDEYLRRSSENHSL